MLKYLLSYFFVLREIKNIEYSLTDFCYTRIFSIQELKDFLAEPVQTKSSSNLIHIRHLIDCLDKLFKRLPISLQKKHIFDINLFKDSCTFYEPYMDYSYASRGIVYNHVLMLYAKLIVPQLTNTCDKKLFLEKLENSFITDLRIDIHNPNYGKIIQKWKLEMDLIEKKPRIKQKISKI